MAMTVSLSDAYQMVRDCFFAKLVPMVTGSPGMGKSSMLHAVAEELNLKIIDIRLAQCDPTDLLGFPAINDESGKATYRPMDMFPLEGDPIPKGYQGWMILLDEMNSADRDVQKACYKVIYDRMVGNKHLHKNCVIAAAGNLATDNAIVEDLSTALQSRMVHIEVSMDHDPNREDWLEWAAENGIDHRVMAYIRYAPNSLFKFNPDHDDKTFSCPRTWEFASRLIQDKKRLTRTDKALIAGTVGEGVGREFTAFCEIETQIPTFREVIDDPKGTQLPNEPSVMFLMTGMIGANLTGDNIGQAIQYINRLPKEYQVIALRDARRRDKTLKEAPEMKQWISENATELF